MEKKGSIGGLRVQVWAGRTEPAVPGEVELGAEAQSGAGS